MVLRVHSFIFNFKMIKKTIFTFLILSISYGLFVQISKPKWLVIQHQWQDNMLKAQSFLFDENRCIENVIVGSSLSDRLIFNDIPGTFNLSFSGLSIFDGLFILQKTELFPKRIFIEINVILKPASKEFIASFSDISNYLKSHIEAFREINQPLGVLGTKIQLSFTDTFIKKLKYKILNFWGTGKSHQKTLPEDNDFIEKRITEIKKDYNMLPDLIALNVRLKELKQIVDFFTQKGVQVVFFEMPTHPELYQTPFNNCIRRAICKQFPPSEYIYFFSPDCSKFSTTDGLHLRNEEINIYMSYFKSELNKLENKSLMQ